MDDLSHGVHHDVHVDQLREVEVNLKTEYSYSKTQCLSDDITSSLEKVNSLLPIYSNTPGSLELKRYVTDIELSNNVD